MKIQFGLAGTSAAASFTRILSFRAFPVTSACRGQKPRPCGVLACLKSLHCRANLPLRRHSEWSAASLVALLLVTLSCAAAAERTTPVSPEATQALSLARLGYSSDIRLEGTDPSFTFYVPVDPHQDLAQGTLSLHLTFSPVLDPDSSVAVLVSDYPVYATRLRELAGIGQEAVIHVPLASRQNLAAAPTLKVEVRLHLFITRNVCEDLMSGNLWAVLHNDSHLLLPAFSGWPQTIARFFEGPFERLGITVPQAVSPENAAAFLKLYAFAWRVLGRRGITVEALPAGQVQPGDGVRLLVLTDDGNTVRLDEDGVLYVGPQAVDGFLSDLRALVTVREARISGPDSASAGTVARARISFEELGYGPVSVRGLHDLRAGYAFVLSDLGSEAAELQVVVFGRYVPVGGKEAQQNPYFKVYLNGTLMKAFRLDNSGQINGLSIELPSYALRQENFLELVYAFYPNPAECTAGTMPVEGVFYSHSYLEVTRWRRTDAFSFAGLPAGFTGSGLIVLPLEDTLPYLLAAADVLAAVRRLDRGPLDLRVVFWSPERTASLRPDGEMRGTDWWLFVLPAWDLSALPAGSYLRKVALPVDASAGYLTVYNPLTREQLFEMATGEPVGVLQAFTYGGRPALALTVHGTGISPMRELARTLLDLNTLRRLRGNVAFWRDGELVSVDVGRKMRVRREGETDFWQLYRKYRLPAFLALMGVLSLVTYQVYARLARPPASR